MKNLPEYIFSDFDGTISKRDVIHNFITTFAKGDWSEAEKLWSLGKISTQECMNIELGLIGLIDENEFYNYLNSVQIDESFITFYNLVKKQNKKLIIISDGLDYFIETILKRYGIDDIKIYSNHALITKRKGRIELKVEYPNNKPYCSIGAGTCKCEIAKYYTNDFLYIGDGLSDRCIAKKSRILFAKKSLETFCKKENIPYFPYKTFQDIIDATLKENLNASNDVKRFINTGKNS